MSDHRPKREYHGPGRTFEPAVNVARAKLAALYKNEPSVKEEAKEAAASHHRSRHQQYMYELTTSGRSLADIQTAWHEYYANLDDKGKHEVWTEFYKAHGNRLPESTAPATQADDKKNQTKPETVTAIKKKVIKSVVGSNTKLSKKQHLHSIIFGLGVGAVAMLIFLFGFFNERFIAPFITPSRSVSATPIIIDPNSTKAGSDPEVIIPKINVEIPVVYTLNTTNEEQIQKSLEDGVVHYSSTPEPGQKGNTVIVGHSSNNIFNSGKYKFAFVLLSKLENGDTFYLTKNSTRYAYRVYSKKIVKPTEVDVLEGTSKTATATLITCDPPGTSINRLVVIGEQISPDPTKNKASTAVVDTPETGIVPGNAPSLWQHIKDVLFNRD